MRGARLSAVVTGHSRGLGEAIAEHLLARGASVVGVARGSSASLTERYPERLTQVQMDLADVESLARWLDGENWRGLLEGAEPALLVNNAGVVQPIGPLDAQTPAAVARAVAVNVSAALMLSAAFIRATRETPDRRILHISSGAGRNAYAGWSIYCATKAALDHHARAVALDQTRGLRFGSIAPGVIDTAMQAEVRATTDDRLPGRRRFVEMKQQGKLLSADQAGRGLVDLLLSDRFGREPVIDLRER